MLPDFSKKTALLLCKRAGSICSNPTCRAHTGGPTEAPDGSVNIGEAAHIYGARPNSKRYRRDITDSQRAESTNGIWLCSNCHTKVDADEQRYSAGLLFEWRKQHEEYITSKLGRPDDAARLSVISRELAGFSSDTALAQQILIERLDGWEYRLTAELLYSYMRGPLRKWRDISAGLYPNPFVTLHEEETIGWFRTQLQTVGSLIEPLGKLVTIELARAWGEPGVPGDAQEIHHICKLIGRIAEQIADWEEKVQSVSVPEEFERLHSFLPDIAGLQLQELERIPRLFNGFVDRYEAQPGEPITLEHKIIFDLPRDWEHKVDAEIERLERQLSKW